MKPQLAVFVILFAALALAQPQGDNATVNHAITSASYTGAVEGDVARFDVEYKIQVFDSRWTQIGLFGDGVVVRDASAPLYYDQATNRFYLITNSAGLQTVTAIVEKKISKGADRDSVSLSIPGATAGTIFFTVPGSLVVDVPGTANQETDAIGGDTVFSADVLPTTASLSIAWGAFKPPEEVKKPLLYADVTTLATLKDASLKTTAQISFSILQAGVTAVSFRVPADQTVLGVTAGNLREYTERTAGAEKVITVFFASETQGGVTVSAELERTTQGQAFTAAVPEVFVEGVERQQGFVAVVSEATAEISESSATGLQRIDPTEFPGYYAQPILLAYKYVNQRYSLVVSVTRLEELAVLTATIDTARVTTLVTRDGKSITRLVYDVKNNKKQYLQIALPAEATVWSTFVNYQAVKPSKRGNVLLVPLTKSQAGDYGLNSFPVEVVYVSDLARLGPIGMQRFAAPSVDLPVSAEEIRVFVPPDYDLLADWGDLEKGGVVTAPPIVPLYAGAPSPQALETKAEVGQFQGAVEAAIIKGVAPVKVSVPEEGNLFIFKRVLVSPEESPAQNIVYMQGLPFALLLWASLGVVAFLLLQARREGWKPWLKAVGFTIVVGYLIGQTLVATIPGLVLGTLGLLAEKAYIRLGKKKR